MWHTCQYRNWNPQHIQCMLFFSKVHGFFPYCHTKSLMAEETNVPLAACVRSLDVPQGSVTYTWHPTMMVCSLLIRADPLIHTATPRYARTSLHCNCTAMVTTWYISEIRAFNKHSYYNFTLFLSSKNIINLKFKTTLTGINMVS